MGIFLDHDELLPGVITEIESDYSLGYKSTDFGTTESVLLLGTAFNGPVGQPIPIYNPEHGEYVFGKTYNAKSRKEATLPSAIKDAYDRGCRHIYAVRVSGGELYKDFDFAVATDLKLRVSCTYPTNDGKDYYFVYDNSTVNNAFIKIYKPAQYATIAEKTKGLVENMSAQIVFTLDLEQSYGLTQHSRLVDLIGIVNKHPRNNTIRLRVINNEGQDVTYTSPEVQHLQLKHLFSGAYFIGREKTTKDTSTKLKYAIDKTTGELCKKLVFNNDVSSNYPITKDNVTFVKHYDMLKDVILIDELFEKEKKDYEEIDLKPFELYDLLGSGFATTAKITKLDNGKYRVVQTPDDDSKKVIPINDGIYSMLENMDVKNRVLTCCFADQKIKGHLPKIDDFIIEKKQEKSILEDVVNITSLVDKKIKLSISNEKEKPNVDENIDLNKIYPIYASTPMILDKGDKFILREGDSFKTKVVDDSSIVNDANIKSNYILGCYNDEIYVFKATEGIENKILTPIGDFDGLIKNKFSATTTVFPDDKGQLEISIKIFDSDVIPLNEFIEYVQNKSALKHTVGFELTPKGINFEEKYMDEVITEPLTVLLDEPQKIVDETLRIPYTTSDGFARQLAQHCTYTSLKTSPTRGYIGLSPLNNMSLKSVSDKVEEAMEMDFGLYAKKPNGHSMLDKNNLPYHIGRNLSITFLQYPVYMNDGYTFVSTGAAGYAGMVSQLPLDQSSTNQNINIPSTMLQLSNYQLTKLTKKGYITCKNSYTKGLVITDGITMAQNDSPHKRLSTLRIMNAVDDLIREAVEPYVGKQNSIANRNSMSTAIKSKLDKVKDVLIQAYDFDMHYDPRTAKFAHVDIDYAVVPIFEIRQVRNRITVKDML